MNLPNIPLTGDSNNDLTIENFNDEYQEQINSYFDCELPSNLLSNSFYIKTKNKLGKPSLPDLPQLDNQIEQYVEIENEDLIENDFMLIGELAEEYQRIKKYYSNLINMFERSIECNDNSINIKEYKFNTLKDFERAIEQGDFKIDNYNVAEINKLIKDLSNLENKMTTRSLLDFNLKTMNDFQKAVDNGILNLSNYETSEITELLNNLEDEAPLTLNDYSITIYGNVILKDVEARIQNQRKPNISQARIITDALRNTKFTKDNSIPPIPTLPPNEIKDDVDIAEENKDAGMIINDSEFNIENENGFFSKFINKIKKIFSKKTKDM